MVKSPAPESPGDRTHVILLGASNLTRAISTIIETAHQYCGEPLEIYAALGHGRSYGMTTSLLGRSLPGIRQCGLWEQVPQGLSSACKALLTDIGNDLLYGVEPDQIADWIQRCLSELAARDAQIVLTRLPLQNLDRLTSARYLMLRTALYPLCRHDLATMSQLARELDNHVQRLAVQYGAHLVPPQGGWYGIDPIHIKLRYWSAAWQTILAPWSESARIGQPIRGSWRRWFYLRTRAPFQRTIFGWSQRHKQPCGVLPNGSAIHFF